eukprot:5436594-Pyramimonas_sp.AAC.1
MGRRQTFGDSSRSVTFETSCPLLYGNRLRAPERRKVRHLAFRKPMSPLVLRRSLGCCWAPAVLRATCHDARPWRVHGRRH